MSEPPLSPGSLVGGRYRALTPLGTGGSSHVWEAQDERLGRHVALKVVSRTDPVDGERLRAEAAVLARLRDPVIVSVYDVGEHDGRAFVVTELVRGRSLAERLRDGPLAAGEAARLGAQLASALASAHRAGVVHRDLKPGNVLVEDATGDARLIDFGIATSEASAALTQTGMVIGTPAYLSPEQVDGRRAGPPSDVYALGLVLLESLTGRRPFPGSAAESAGARLAVDAPLPDDLSAGWAGLLGAMTRRDPSARPSAADAAASLPDLAGSAADGPGATPTVVAPERTREAPALDPHPTEQLAPPVGATGAAAGAAAAAAALVGTAPDASGAGTREAAGGQLGEPAGAGGEPPYVSPWGGADPGGSPAGSRRSWLVLAALAGAAAAAVLLAVGALTLLGGDDDQPATAVTPGDPAVTAPTTTAAPPGTEAEATTTTAEATTTTTEAPEPTTTTEAPKEPPGKGGGKDDPKDQGPKGKDG